MAGGARCQPGSDHLPFEPAGLELDERLAKKGAAARSGLAVIDVASGNLVHWLELGGEMRELYDVQVLPGVRCPKALGLSSKEIWGRGDSRGQGGVVRHTGIVEE